MVNLTGITEFTLRGWELRYSAFEPVRTDTGRRRYSDRDLQRALLLRELVKREHKIGEIASKSLNELKELVASQPDPMPIPTLTPVPRFKGEIQGVIKSVALKDWAHLESIMSRTVGSRVKPINVILEFFLPLFEQMGLEVAAGRMSISQEHILSAMLKHYLNRLTPPGQIHPRFKVVVASPEGDFHELGILTANAMAIQAGLQTLFVGPNMPKDQLCESAIQFGATHLILGSSVTASEGAKEDFYHFVHFLDQHIPKDVTFWLGGRASQPVTLNRKFFSLISLAQLQQKLSELGGVIEK